MCYPLHHRVPLILFQGTWDISLELFKITTFDRKNPLLLYTFIPGVDILLRIFLILHQEFNLCVKCFHRKARMLTWLVIEYDLQGDGMD